jgi:hypothetical protein
MATLSTLAFTIIIAAQAAAVVAVRAMNAPNELGPGAAAQLDLPFGPAAAGVSRNACHVAASLVRFPALQRFARSAYRESPFPP